MSKVIILDGNKLSEKILDELKKKIEASSKRIRLAVVLVGQDPVSLKYIEQKKKACKKIGADFRLYQFSENISTRKLRRELANITKATINTGIIIQLPLPEDINRQYILDAIPSEKDVDLLSSSSLGKFYTGKLDILPPTAGGVLRLLDEYKISIKGKNVVIVGAGSLVGKPLSILMMQKEATVTVCNNFTKNLGELTKKADILVSGVGKPGLITGKMVKNGVVIIDAGFSTIDKGVRGDVDFDSVAEKASYITPVPGGVGPMTVAVLLSNLIKLASVDKR